MGTGFLWGNLREGEHLEDLGLEGDTIEMDLQDGMREIWPGLIWLRIALVKAVMNLRVA